MANLVLMPQKGISEETAVLAQWYVKIGDSVKPGDNLFSLETGKAAFDVESEVEGVVLELFHTEGEELPIKTPVCVIGKQGEAYARPEGAPAAAAAPAPAQTAAEATAAPAQPVSAAAPLSPAGERIAASPRAKALAEKAGVTLTGIAPTGPEGRIIERDVNSYLNSGRTPAIIPEVVVPVQEAAASPAEFEEKPISRVRRVIGDNMYKSLSNSAQLTLNASFDATALLTLRAQVKTDKLLGLSGVTINDFVLFAVSRTLPGFPELNAHFTGDTIKYFRRVNLAFACDTDKGLLVPVIFGADRMSLLELSQKAKELAAAAQNGSISPDLLSGGSFTVSNLGSLGIESFTPVINPPQTGILGVNTLVPRVRQGAAGPEVYQSMPLSLTFDHRALDGAPAARFLQALCRNLENITLLLMK